MNILDIFLAAIGGIVVIIVGKFAYELDRLGKGDNTREKKRMIDKTIDRIIDNYYTKKLLEETSWCFKVRYLDYRYIYYKNEVEIAVKKAKYSNEYYKSIIHIQKDEALKYLLNYDKFRESLVKIIDDYLDKNKE